ncbi:MAG: bifunctional 4-hydroxy-2-oxoglutarate aldolase/2-dehydro-3-deoxy-phosphogluconate aldolase [Acidimicrobiia bacterium]
MTRPALPPVITEQRLIAIARRLSPQEMEILPGALLAGGIAVLEVTLDGADAVSTIAALDGSGLLVGAGTVMSVAQAAEAAEAGAAFIVSPHTDEAVVEWAVGNAMPVMAGAATPTEIARAWDLGSSAVKLFPASLGGPSLLRTLRGPFSQVDFVPTGGVQEGNVVDYLEAGAVAVGVGSWLTGSSEPAVIEERAARLRSLTGGR